MNHAIHTIDSAIAHITSDINQFFSDGRAVKRRGEAIKHLATLALKEVEAPKSILDAVKNISFDSIHTSELTSSLYANFESRYEGMNTTYRLGAQAILNILNQEKTRILKQQQEEEAQKNFLIQKKSNRIQIWSLVFAIIAAIVGTASLLLTIFTTFVRN